MSFTVDDMRRFAIEAWGPFGDAVVDRWVDYNGRYFNGTLRPVPLVLTHAQPYGRRLAFCSYHPDPSNSGIKIPYGQTITLNVPASHMILLADNNTLLHEMIHQYLSEQGEDAAHASEAGAVR